MNKILLITDNAFTYSGREKICDYMASIYGEDNYVDLLSLEGDGVPFYKFHGVKEIFTFQNKKLKYIKMRCMSRNYDYVFVLSMGKLSVFYQMFNLFSVKSKNKKDYACEHVSLESLGILVKTLKYIFLRRYSKVITLTQTDCDKLNSWGIKSQVIENPIFPKKHNSKGRTYSAIAVGRLSKQKNFLELIDIWRLFILKSGEKYKLYIAGEGEDRVKIESYIKEHNLGDNIKLLGKVDDIERYYESVDICLMTSLYEGLPLALLEAKSYGLPCIAYDCPTGPREIINHNIDGYIVKLHDKSTFVSYLQVLFTENELYSRFTMATKTTVNKFSPVKIKKKWNDLLK